MLKLKLFAGLVCWVVSVHGNKTVELRGHSCCAEMIPAPMEKCPDNQSLAIACDDFKFLRVKAQDLHGQDGLSDGLICIYYREDDNVLVAFCKDGDVEIQYHQHGHNFKVIAYCLIISVGFLLVTFLIYCCFPKLRDLQGKCVMSLVACLMLGYLSLIMLQYDFVGLEMNNEFCVFSGFSMYFWMLCTFFWLHNLSFNTWRSSSLHQKWTDQQYWIAYNVVGYGIPGAMLMFLLWAHIHPGEREVRNFTHENCWLQDSSTEILIYFYGPIGTLLCFNTIFFLTAGNRLWKTYHSTRLPQSKMTALRTRCILYLKLFLTMGISWIFEVISWFMDLNWFYIDIINCLQGVIIFVVMIATRKRVLKMMAGSNMFRACSRPSWRTFENLESDIEDDVMAEEIPLH